MPNLVVIMTDQLKATALDLYWEQGCTAPNLTNLARDGVLYRNAFTPHPLCVPARVSMWTSQYAHTHGARRNETMMPHGAGHAFRIWKEQGYTTGLIGKNHCFDTEDDLALFDVWCTISHRGLGADETTKGMEWVRPRADVDSAHSTRRNMPWQHPAISTAVSENKLDDTSTGLIAGQTEQFIDQIGEKPFALWVSFPDPHEPYEAQKTYYDRISEERVILPPQNARETERAPERNRILQKMLGVDDPALLKEALRIYYANILFIDDAVGRIIDALKRNGLDKKTVVVFCSDHGDFMGEHGMTVKGGVFYDCLTRVPLIVSWPGHVPAGRIDDSMVNLIDIVPTFFSLQEIEVPDAMQGLPLPTCTDTAPRDEVFSEYGAGGPRFTEIDLEAAPRPFGYHTVIQSLRWREAAGRRKMVRTRQWKFVHDPMGDIDELYDLEKDPWELENLIESDEHSDVRDKMKDRLLSWSVRYEDPSPVPLPDAKLNLKR